MKKEIKKSGIFDDLLGGESAKRLGISKQALKDLEKLEAGMHKGGAPALETGKATAVVQFVEELHCACGAVYRVPSFQSMMLKRCFTGGTMRVIYTPLTSRSAHPSLPRRVEVQQRHIFTCEACFCEIPKTQLMIQIAICLYCGGNHQLEDCKAWDSENYRKILRREAAQANFVGPMPQGELS